VVVLVAGTLLVVLLTENARIPVDDPATHLELTMIHEAMVLDHGGPDLALIQYGAALKLWVSGTLLTGLLLPMGSEATLLNLVSGLGGLLLVGVAVGLIESTMARLRLVTVPQLLAASVALASVAFILVMGYGH
jgi:formate hydrogenlyase subunit 4